MSRQTKHIPGFRVFDPLVYLMGETRGAIEKEEPPTPKPQPARQMEKQGSVFEALVAVLGFYAVLSLLAWAVSEAIRQ